MTTFHFFSGKGGVGKSSIACTTAVHSADAGQRTLLITTDPASNLSDIFEQPIGHAVTPIEGVPNLWAMELDPDRATEEYIDRAMAPIRAAFPAPMVAVMEEQMSGPCTAEVAAFDRFTDFLEAPAEGAPRFDLVIFDTAPTGHTLRLIELPAAWSDAIEQAEEGSGQTCIGPAAAIQEAKHKYARAVATMRDGERTTFTFVLHPEATSLKETERAIGELRKLGIHAHRLVVNSVIPEAAAASPLFAARRAMQARYLDEIARALPLPTRQVPLFDSEIKGIARLREVAALLFEGQPTASADDPLAPIRPVPPSPLSDVLPRLLPENGRRTLFFAGKGGVGKSVASCLTAVWLARQGYRTLLLTTDPAAHLGDVLGAPVGDEVGEVAGVPNLWATKIDPRAAGERYTTRILDDARARGRAPEAIAVMAEELNSPCTEEIAAFDLFIDYATQDRWEVIVFDTAPTGHTLRMLELPMEWSKQLDVKVFSTVESTAADDVAKGHFGEVIDMMRDPARSTFALVMYPEATPILEAQRAADDLATLGIRPGLIVANLVLPPEVEATPFGHARRALQQRYLAEIDERFALPVVQIPLLPSEVKGIEMLDALGERLYGAMVPA